MRRWVWPDGSVSAERGRGLVRAEPARPRASAPEWARLLHRGDDRLCRQPDAAARLCRRGHAAWLIDQIERDGAPITPTELALVVKVLETRAQLPASLKSWALAQIERSVLARRPTSGDAEEGRVSAAPDRLRRRRRRRADRQRRRGRALWRIKDACLHADNAPGWKTLFVQAVGNHLMAYSSYTPLERERGGAARRLRRRTITASVLGFFARMGGPSPVASAARRSAKRPRGRS